MPIMTTFKKSKIIFIALSSLFCLPVLALTAPDFIVNLMSSTNDSFMNENTRYAFIYSASTSEIPSEDSGKDSSSVSAFEWRGTIGDSIISIPYGSNSEFSPSSLTNTQPNVIYNFTTGNVGIITNEISIKFSPNVDASHFVNKFNLTLLFEYKNFNLAFYSFSHLTNIPALLKSLSNSPDTIRFSVDIIENTNEAL